MKKLLSLTLALMLVLFILSSCVILSPNSTVTETKTDTEANTITTTNTNTDEIKEPEADKTDLPTISFSFTYDYGFHKQDENGEPIASLLVDGGYLRGGFEGIEIPDDIVAGDVITIKYTGGEIITQETYPSHTYLYDGEVISYSFDYADVIYYDNMSLKQQKNNLNQIYDFEDSYVILNKTGKFVSLDEYEGEELYLVTDHIEYQEVKEQLSNTGSTKYPIACMLAFDPRDIGNLTPEPEIPQRPVSELRNEKVVFDLDYHHYGDELEKDYIKEDPTKHLWGYIDKNVNGNEFIEYAPNIFSYTVLVEFTENNSPLYSTIRRVLKQFEPYYSTDRKDVDIDVQELSSNMILVTFPDFDTYFTCQDELLDNLSVLNCVEKIHVGYIGSQNGTYRPKNPYVIYADLGSRFHTNVVFTTYEEYINTLGAYIESSKGLQKIKESTFEENYVFVVTNNHWREFKINDARLVGDTVYFTNNEFQGKNQLHDAMLYENSCVIVIPRDEIGVLPQNVSVKTVDVPIYIDEWADYTDAQGAIIIALEHFSANYNTALPEGFTYKAEQIDGTYDYYWYIIIYPEYISDSNGLPDSKGDSYLYTIDKFTKEVVEVEIQG